MGKIRDNFKKSPLGKALYCMKISCEDVKQNKIVRRSIGLFLIILIIFTFIAVL